MQNHGHITNENDFSSSYVNDILIQTVINLKKGVPTFFKIITRVVFLFLFTTGKYAYIEATGMSQGDNAKLVKGGFSFSSRKCLSFYYHMYGSTMGTLNVYVGQKKIFTKTGDQGNQWKQAMVNITDPGASEV